MPAISGGFSIQIEGDDLIVTHPETSFYAIYTRASGRRLLILKFRRHHPEDHALVMPAWEAANTKARELGWIK